MRRSPALTPPPPALAAMTALYAAVRVVGAVAAAATHYPDSRSYLAVARQPLWSADFLAGERPWALPLLYKALPADDAWRVGAQVAASVIAWVALATVAAVAVRSDRLRPWAFAAVLVFSLSFAITRWDALVLTESLTISLTAGALAAWMALAARPNVARAGVALAVTLWWAFVRDVNGAAVALAVPAVVASVPFWRRRWLPAGLALCMAGIAGVSYLTTTTDAAQLRRVHRPMLGSVGIRVLADPGMRSFFRDHGMPAPPARVLANPRRLKGLSAEPSPDPETKEFLDWVRERARPTMARYLAAHPHRAVPTLVTKRDDLLWPVGGYRAPGARNLLPPIVRQAIYPSPPLIVLALALAAMLAAGAAARRRIASAPLAVPVAGLLLVVPYAAIVWHGDAFEVGRHALVVQLLVRLCPLLIGLLVLDAVKGKSPGSSNKRPS